MIKNVDNKNQNIANQLLAISLKAYEVEAEIINCPEFPALTETLGSLIKSKSTFYGCFYSDQLVGAIEVDKQKNPQWINRLVVHPKYFKGGIATALLKQSIKDNKYYCVGTAERNYPAINLYKKLGFKYKGRKQVGSPSTTWVTYVLESM